MKESIGLVRDLILKRLRISQHIKKSRHCTKVYSAYINLTYWTGNTGIENTITLAHGLRTTVVPVPDFHRER
jgi:hypothetical protein